MWLGRRWRSARAWFSRRSLFVKTVLRLGFIFAILTSPGCCLFGWFVVRVQYNYWFIYTPEDREFQRTPGPGYNGGLPSAARQLRAEMEQIPDPDTALGLHPDWEAHRFPNREWVFGYGIDSHALTRVGGGTLVVKDSHGRVRCFFGHVCGNRGTCFVFDGARQAKSVDDFYKYLQSELGFREWIPPP